MNTYRIDKHPILPIPEHKTITVFWEGNPLPAHEGETISAALIANGIRIFGYHPRDHSPQGIFCANGQCAQCMVLANERPVKACMTLVQPNMQIKPLNGLPALPVETKPPVTREIPRLHIPVLIIGGGPAGLSAGIELGKQGVETLLIDDKHRLGGKLVLQTHRFFGSTQAVYAGTRGIDIATRLENELSQYPTVKVWLESTALAVFSDYYVGIWKNGTQYVLVRPDILLVATGAREKFLAFPGNTLPGVYGAGAFQTLVNRDLVRPAERLFIVGGGNVGLIAGYHALQAGITVVGLAEAMPEVGGYKVHRDKLARMGVPIYTSHTILSANGHQKVESVTIAQVNEKFQPIPGTEKTFPCDSILIAVGLDPVNEFYIKAKEFGMKAFVAGDAEEIAEASAAIYSGKIAGLSILKEITQSIEPIPEAWFQAAEILKSRPGKNVSEAIPDIPDGVMPIIHCTQEIPCNPCSTLCTKGLIFIPQEDIRSVPVFMGDSHSCSFCLRCVSGCPGLAITVVDYRADPQHPRIAIPYEFNQELLKKGDKVILMSTEGEELGTSNVQNIVSLKDNDRTLVVLVQAPREIAPKVAGIRIQPQEICKVETNYTHTVADETIVCRCERVSAGEIRALIREGYRDINEIKAITRAGMGACGSKTCSPLILRIFREEGIPLNEITLSSKRPLFVEVPLGLFAGTHREETQEESHE
ncbi:FAD-dependent oxidoreductase [Anaerolinea sp.]|uniref:FAD-dependent oxidoreductase n=1 Tax=Anaerolinea sp. TaxID=1872519 RepID=UPI002ACDA595|nr:FAD-dependent oxidoreductase [Anaerolinea sp.]